MSSVYAALAEVVYIPKLTNKYILVKYNGTGMFSRSSCYLYNKLVIVPTLLYMSDSQLSATTIICRLSAHIRLKFIE